MEIYKVANILFSIEGCGSYYDALTNYFSEKATAESGKQDLIIKVYPIDAEVDNFLPDYYSLSGSIAFNHSSFFIRKKNYSYIVSNLFDNNKPTDVILIPHHADIFERMKSMIRVITFSKYTKYDSFTEKVAAYDCLWYIFAITLMKKNCVFVHSGMMSKDNLGVILTGTGGCGKTSTMMELITSSEFKYMAEDFGILDVSGIMYDMQKKAAIYQSDVKWGNKYLLSVVRKLKYGDRLFWNFKNLLKMNPCHLFKPSEIFEDNIEHASKVKDVFFLQRTLPTASIICNIANHDHIAERIKTASFRELKELYEILSNIRAVGGEKYYADYPSITELERKYVRIITQALEHTKCYELVVPLKVKPSLTVKEVLKNI